MYIGTYGTLRYGEALHAAIASCSCVGLARISGNYIMVITPAGFPAIVEVSGGYMNELLQSDGEWWEQYQEAHPDLNFDPSGWTDAQNGFDYPLMELYNVNTNAIIRRLDMIEGVPQLYHRIGCGSYVVKEDTSQRCGGDATYRAALKKFGEARPELTLAVADSTHPYLEAYAMLPTSEWLQGCEIVWNGDFSNQIIHPTLRFDYIEWRGGLRDRGLPDGALGDELLNRVRRRRVVR